MARPTLVKLPGLYRARSRAFLTQRQLAERAGVRIPTISRLEHGGECYLRTAAWLARALGVEPDLLTREAPGSMDTTRG